MCRVLNSHPQTNECAIAADIRVMPGKMRSAPHNQSKFNGRIIHFEEAEQRNVEHVSIRRIHCISFVCRAVVFFSYVFRSLSLSHSAPDDGVMPYDITAKQIC